MPSFEKPYIVTLSTQVPEDSHAGFVVGAFTADDPDNEQGQMQTLTFTLTNSAQGKFKVTGNNLVVSVVLHIIHDFFMPST